MEMHSVCGLIDLILIVDLSTIRDFDFPELQAFAGWKVLINVFCLAGSRRNSSKRL